MISNNALADNLALPEADKIETLVLSELVSNPEFMPRAKSCLTTAMFANKTNAQTWDILNDMFDNGNGIDLVSLMARIGQPIAMNYTAISNANEITFVGHCEAIRTASVRRSLYAGALQMLRASTDMTKTIDQLVAIPGKLSTNIENSTTFQGNNQSIGEAFEQLAQRLEADQVAKSKGLRTKIPTGFPFLDLVLGGGMESPDLVILSGRTSVGKTAIMLQMAKEASKAGFATTIYSLEMENEQLAQRWLFSTELVTPRQIAEGNIDWQGFEKANQEFSNLPLYLNDQANTLDAITSNILLNHQQGRCDIAFVDYLTIVTPSNTRATRVQQVTEMSNRFKRLAKECRIPIVLMCQCNRELENEGRSPQLHDLKDSGSIEQDADIVLMLERESRELNDPNVNMWVRKNRHGKAGDVLIKLMGNQSFTAFHERD